MPGMTIEHSWLKKNQVCLHQVGIMKTVNMLLLNMLLSLREDFNPDCIPSFLEAGTSYIRRMEQRLTMRKILASVGWTRENKENNPNVTKSITPLKVRSSADWKTETTNCCWTKEKRPIIQSLARVLRLVMWWKWLISHISRKHFMQERVTPLLNNLNREQERSFRIIANHASGHRSQQAQLKMYIAGMGGTGKSQVLKALSYFFELRKESNRFVIVAPTGSAASLLGGSTYHYMFGINEHSGTLSNFAKVLSRLSGVDYVFFDEVSMLSARDLYRISYQLAHTFNKPEAPFGGMNMVFCGDFAQLPPVPGGESKSLYSHTIGALGTFHKKRLLEKPSGIK